MVKFLLDNVWVFHASGDNPPPQAGRTSQISDWKKQLLGNASDVFGKVAQKAEQSA